VVELKVDEDALLERIERRIAETKARGETLRDDDDPDVLRRRILAYRDQTAPLATYYQLQSVLRSVNGMAPIPEVSKEIDRVIEKAPPKTLPLEKPAAKKPQAEIAPPKAPSRKTERAKTSGASGAKTSGEKTSRTKTSRTKTSRTKAAGGAAEAAGARKPGGKPPQGKGKAAKSAGRTRTAGSRKSNRQRRLTKRR
jgi:adenylate kinase